MGIEFFIVLPYYPFNFSNVCTDILFFLIWNSCLFSLFLDLSGQKFINFAIFFKEFIFSVFFSHLNFFDSVLFLVIPFILLALALIHLSIFSSFIMETDHWFESFLLFWHKYLMLWISLLALFSLHPVKIEMLHFHFNPV